MDAATAAATGFALGLSSGGLCFWSCASVMGPFLVSASPMPDARRWSSVPGTARTLLVYNLGRLLAYLATGLLLVVVASWGASMPGWVQASLRLATAAVLAWSLWRPTRGQVCRRGAASPGGAFALGALQGFSPCPPFVAAIGLALSASNALAGIVLFFALFCSTALFTLPLAFIEPIVRRRWLTSLMIGLGIATCIYLVISAILLSGITG